MRLKAFLVVLVLTSVFCVVPVAFAQTMTDAQRQALIAQIEAQIAIIQQQINQILAQRLTGTCAPSWQCTAWTVCDKNTQSRTCTDANYCGIQTGKPALTNSCTPCIPSWSCGNWSICTGLHTRTCTDANNCGVTTKEPLLSEACVPQSAIALQANGSDGPVNLFLTLGNGAVVHNSGFTLTKDINLQWIGVDVASCVASDSIIPTIFSGYVPSSSSQTVTLSGDIQAGSSNNKVTDTFKINCVSVKTGSSVSDSVTVNLFYTTNSLCTPSWSCTAWTTCASSKHTRTCTDLAGCGSLVGKPAESESCVVLPTVDIKANSFNGPVTVSSGATVNLSWTSTGATSCTASGGWSGTKNTSGTETSSAITSSEVFSITCNNAGGSYTDSVTVNVASGT